MIIPLPEDKILDWSKLKQSADDNFEFDVNSRKFSKLLENTVGKREIAHYEQFLFSHSVFKRLVSQGRQKVSLCGNGLNHKFETIFKILYLNAFPLDQSTFVIEWKKSLFCKYGTDILLMGNILGWHALVLL